MDIKSLIEEKLPLDLPGKIVGFCKIGNRVTLYGYIRKVTNDYTLFEDIDTGEQFKIKYVISFEEIVLK